MTDSHVFNLRVPAELWGTVVESAAAGRRSIHAEFLWLVEAGLAAGEWEGVELPGLALAGHLEGPVSVPVFKPDFKRWAGERG